MEPMMMTADFNKTNHWHHEESSVNREFRCS